MAEMHNYIAIKNNVSNVIPYDSTSLIKTNK